MSMLYYKLPPPTALSGVVRFFWVLEGGTAADTPLLYRLFADGCPGVLVQYGSQFSDYTPTGLQPVPTCFYHGASAAYSDTSVSGAFGLLGAYLYPAATRLLTGVPAGELTGLTLDAALLLGSTAEVVERVCTARSAQERVEVFAAFLLQRFRCISQARNHCLEAVVSRLLRVRSGFSVDEMARITGLSLRQFERAFARDVGLPPKLFSRIVRFQGVLVDAGRRNGTLTELAYDRGYSDQSHFIRDFKEFAGMNPRQYFSHLDDAAESLIQTS